MDEQERVERCDITGAYDLRKGRTPVWPVRLLKEGATDRDTIASRPLEHRLQERTAVRALDLRVDSSGSRFAC